tara:strand:- start:173 stop:898 length:726 start_codon:yes stop_codon:yes gene_type:complete
MEDPYLFYSVIGVATVIAGIIRGFAGFGGPLFLLPLLTIFLPPAVSAGIVIWVDLFANIRLLPEARHESSRNVVIPLVVGTFAFMPIGTYLLISLDHELMKRVISFAILSAAIALMSGWRYTGMAGWREYAVVGTVSGTVMGATSIAVLTALFLNSGGHTARQNRANFIVWCFFATLLFLLLLGVSGTLVWGNAVTIAILTPLYLLGTALGVNFHRDTSDKMIRRVILALIMTVALVGLIF